MPRRPTALDLLVPVTPCKAPEVTPDAEPPEWVHLLPVGVYKGHTSGEFELGPAEFAAVLRNFTNGGIDLVIDFEHQTLNTEWNGQPAPAMGWADQLEVREDGVWGHVRAWTDRGAAMLRSREYRYLSPVIVWWHEDRHTGQPLGAWLHSAALTNIPFFAGDLTPVVARSTPSNGLPMRVTMLTLLGLAAKATEPEEQAAVEQLKTDHQALCARLGLPDTTPLATVLRQAATNMVPMADHLAALGQADRQAQALTDDQLVATARADGRLTPAQEPQIRSWLTKDRTAATAWLAAQPRVVPVEPLSRPTGEGAPGALDPTAASVAKQLGLTAEQMNKARKAGEVTA